MNSLMHFPFLKTLTDSFHHQKDYLYSVFSNPLCIDEQNNKVLDTFRLELKDYLYIYPDTRHVDVYLSDINGIMRGKRITVDTIFSLREGCYFPLSVYTMNGEGKMIDYGDSGNTSTEPDCLCLPVPGTLRPCARDPEHCAQLLLTMQNPDGLPCELEPRNILENILAKLHERGLYPVVAGEIEFYLINSIDDNVRSVGCFQMDTSPAQSGFIDAIEAQALAQSLPLTGVVAEAEAGQFEINLRHSDKVVEVCENILAMKRIVRQVSDKYGHEANFMAKPFSLLAGSGLHFHISLNDSYGNNVFASPEGKPSTFMRQSLAGLLTLMPASYAIMAPNVNSYRRLRKNLKEPQFSSWGYNDRSAALRIPCSDNRNRRIEYRLAGADANPYLVMATILAGILYGLNSCSK